MKALICRRAIAGRRLIGWWMEAQHALGWLAVDQHLLFVCQEPARSTVLARMNAEGDLVSRPEQHWGPAAARQHRRRASFDRPCHRTVAAGLGQHLYRHMRSGPDVVLHRSGKGYRPAAVIHGEGMVGTGFTRDYDPDA